ncbi:adenine nucleotide alpha-hydrolase family protein [Oceanomicrobium pacificus]|uniref:Adenine nucleotide alpha hydrolase n=1 Tax=Oceanomicrobium pacificus TaxID=2692916 RepID=A0A6B0TW24_9RHOB|nr:adenine nucleotide alpha hydrolase [Oceanomicrobium pacificus]MXU65193.1 adenine nucleotide alpha hydrolase [Oceanomicrobium pacificus]
MTDSAAPDTPLSAAQERLGRIIDALPGLTIAVSGGTDSLTLATFAGRRQPRLSVLHALSPAVPPDATARVRALAATEGWALTCRDAGEFADPDYLANPVNRCFFCKSNLYDTIRKQCDGPVASGTNLDDLGDFRPGLEAARARGVLHPLAEAGLTKRDIRALARRLGLGDLSDLPAQPCLSSRIETGLPIHAGDLAFVDAMETALRAAHPGADLRCRITRAGVRIESSKPLSAADRALAARRCAEAGRDFAGITPYRRGSAFLHGADRSGVPT